MKTKNLLLAMTALTALTLSGCSENEVTDINPDAKPAMTFDVYTGVQTKGKETTTSTIQGNSVGFGVLAYQTTDAWATSGSSASPNLMYNEHVTYTGAPTSAWGYTNTKFWPTNEDKISFFAYAPYENQAGEDNKTITLSGSSTPGGPTISFAVNKDNLTQMVDLVTDSKKDQVYTTNTTTKGTVSFELKHVLTKVVLKAKTSSDLGSVTKVFITGVSIDPGSSKLCSKATYKFSDDTWDYTTTTPTYYSDDIDLYNADNGVLKLETITDGWGYTKTAINITNSETALFKDNEALYFIPVGNTTGLGTAGDVKLKVSYDIVTKVTDSSNTTSETKDKEINLPAGALARGNSYTYTLIISMHDIKLTGEVSAWTNATENLELPTEPKE